jgi:Ca-activated chloride channel homolog
MNTLFNMGSGSPLPRGEGLGVRVRASQPSLARAPSPSPQPSPRGRGGKTMRLQSLVAVIGCALLSACGKSPDPKPAAAPKVAVAAPVETNTLSILATTDLRDIAPLEAMVQKATGVTLKFSFGGTMESTEQVLTGKSTADVAWFANAKYLLSDPQGQAKVKLQEKIMLSPIVVGVSESEVARLGWTDASKVTWKTVMEGARSGKLKYALSNPATSNQGYMALVGVVAAVSQKAEALTAADIDRKAVADFLKGYKLVGDNSTYLSEKFIEQQGVYVNAFINYESWLLSMNQSGKLKEPLKLFYPREGIATADYPFMLLNDAKRGEYQKVADYLKGEEAQSWLARTTLRRPVNPAAASAASFPTATLVELPFSPDRGLADGLIDAYLNEFRKPIASTFVLDTSGSMNGGTRRSDLISALHSVAGADASLTGRLARLSSRERIWMLPFAELVGQPTYFEIPAATAADTQKKADALGTVRDYATALKMQGGTALYDAIYDAVVLMNREQTKNRGYQYSVIAFTDGESNKGRDLNQFKADYAALPEDARAIPVFTVAFGEASEAALKEVSKLSGGKSFDARKMPLSAVFKEIRAYQ